MPVKACVAECVRHLDIQPVRVPGLRFEHGAKDDARRCLFQQFPLVPEHQAVEGRHAVSLVDAQLLIVAIEGVGAVGDAVGPGNKIGSPVTGTELPGCKRHHKVAPVVRERAQRGAHRRDYGAVAA